MQQVYNNLTKSFSIVSQIFPTLNYYLTTFLGHLHISQETKIKYFVAMMNTFNYQAWILPFLT
jgi:hypothetical protein